MNGSKEAFALALAERFPEFRMAYQEHLEDYFMDLIGGGQHD